MEEKDIQFYSVLGPDPADKTGIALWATANAKATVIPCMADGNHQGVAVAAATSALLQMGR